MDRFAARFEEDAKIIERAKGAWLHCKNEEPMLDYLLGNCTQTLGHCHPRMVDAIRKQAQLGMNVGDHLIEQTAALANRICAIAKKDCLRFVNSGSEACHLAIRLARASTGRRTILKFDSHYHGWFAEELPKFLPEFPYASGLNPKPEIISIPWNDEQALRSAIAKYELAAVICEPILCHSGVIPPIPGFLELLRKETKRIGAVLIFDECITGFRVAMGGGQEYCNVWADIVVYAKALSQGVPFAVCAGTEAVMQPLMEGKAYQGASYDAHPLGVVAATEALNIFEEEKTFAKLETFGQKLQNQLIQEFDRPVICQAIPGAFQFFFTEKKALTNYEEVFKYSDVQFNKTLINLLRLQRVNLGRADIREFGKGWMGQWFTSTAHGDKEIAFTVEALRKCLEAAYV